MTEDNSHAGRGAVLLDIGGDIGALVVTMPAAMEGVEVEIRPVGAGDTALGDTAVGDPAPGAWPEHHHDPVHEHEHEHEHDQNHGHGQPHEHASPWPHVAVVARPAPAGIVYSLVYAQLPEGSYELYVRPHGPVEVVAHVTGAQVTEAVWPA